jgi:hypothetical protein
MVPKLLAALEFRSNNERHRPVMQALELVKRFADTKLRTFPVEEEVPLEGVVRGLWRDAVLEKDAAGRDRINRVTYEVAVLEALREQLRCKEIWVVGANRYRNPDEDLPADFEGNREAYYKALNLPLDADHFITQLQGEMREALGTLDAGLKKNPAVRIGPKGGGWITHHGVISYYLPGRGNRTGGGTIHAREPEPQRHRKRSVGDHLGFDVRKNVIVIGNWRLH